MQNINCAQFLSAFAKTWNAHSQSSEGALEKAYSDNTAWTNYMLSRGGLLHDVMLRLRSVQTPLEYFGEIYTIDAIYAGGIDLYKNDLCYPSKLDVLIEHENREDIETEMWKLIFWRSPLKVLIFYDWNEDRKTTSARKNWLLQKLAILRDMLEKANHDYPECRSTEYIFLIGNRVNTNSPIRWRWSSSIEQHIELLDNIII